jgi:hypothetical protein
MRPTAVIRIWGAHAQRFVHRHATATLRGLFARSLHLEAQGAVICIGDAAIGAGPLNATLDPASWREVRRRLPASGHRACINAGTIAIGDALFTARPARAWQPPPWPRAIAPPLVAAGLRCLARHAERRAPTVGLARLVMAASRAPTLLHRVASPRIDRLAAWIRARLSQPVGVPAPVDLLGLGPGLTPSGDDLLCGVLVALNAMARADVALDLHAALIRAPAGATSVLSRSLLAAAAEGQGGEPLHALIIALLQDQAIDHALDALSRHGHSSGWDTLAGVAIALSAARAGVDALATSNFARRGTAWAGHGLG